MCRRNWAIAWCLIAFGVGMLVGGWVESCGLRMILAGGCGGVGILILRENPWHIFPPR